MAKRNVGLEIAIILVAAVAFGVAFYFYLDQTMPKLEPVSLVPPSERADGTASADHNSELVHALAALWGRQLSAGDVAGALSSMAPSVRAELTVEQFAQRVAANPYLASVQEIAVLRTTEQRLGNDPASASLRGTGVLKSKAGSVEITLHFVPEGADLKILSALIAGVPALQASP